VRATASINAAENGNDISETAPPKLRARAARLPVFTPLDSIAATWLTAVFDGHALPPRKFLRATAKKYSPSVLNPP